MDNTQKQNGLIWSVQEMNVLFAEMSACPGLCFGSREAGLIDSSRYWDVWVK